MNAGHIEGTAEAPAVVDEVGDMLILLLVVVVTTGFTRVELGAATLMELDSKFDVERDGTSAELLVLLVVEINGVDEKNSLLETEISVEASEMADDWKGRLLANSSCLYMERRN